MREILFRGKRTDNEEWVYGFLADYIAGVKASINPEYMGVVDEKNFYCVDPATVGQYTGLTDKNGKRIFEGDVVAYYRYGNLAVVWDDGAFQLMREDTFYDMLDHYTIEFAVVIGNIRDNPELLEVKE